MEGTGTAQDEAHHRDAKQEQQAKNSNYDQQWEDAGSDGEGEGEGGSDVGLWDNEGSDISDADSGGSPANSSSAHILDNSTTTIEQQQQSIVHSAQGSSPHHQGHHGMADSSPLVTLGQSVVHEDPSSGILDTSASFDRSSVPPNSVYPMSPPLSSAQNGKASVSRVSKDTGVSIDDAIDVHASSAEHKVGQQPTPAPTADATSVLTYATLADNSENHGLHHGLNHGNASTNSSFMSAVQSFHVTPGLGLGLGLGLGSEFGSMSYTESLVHQLKVARSKNEMLQGKLRDIEELVDKNYGSISERSKLLTAERNK